MELRPTGIFALPQEVEDIKAMPSILQPGQVMRLGRKHNAPGCTLNIRTGEFFRIVEDSQGASGC